MRRYQLEKLARNINTILDKWGISKRILRQILPQ
jgi:hypothetical protein